MIYSPHTNRWASPLWSNAYPDQFDDSIVNYFLYEYSLFCDGLKIWALLRLIFLYSDLFFYYFAKRLFKYSHICHKSLCTNNKLELWPSPLLDKSPVTGRREIPYTKIQPDRDGQAKNSQPSYRADKQAHIYANEMMIEKLAGEPLRKTKQWVDARILFPSPYTHKKLRIVD